MLMDNPDLYTLNFGIFLKIKMDIMKAYVIIDSIYFDSSEKNDSNWKVG